MEQPDVTRVSEPSCQHAPKGRVEAGDPEGAYASTYTCDREGCIADAKRWAAAIALAEPRYIPREPPRPTLFDWPLEAS